MPITHDQIGSESFIRVDGPLKPPGLELENITGDAIDGIALRQKAMHASAVKLTALVDVAAQADVETKINAYATMRGTIVTIIQRGQTRNYYAILDAEVTDVKTGSVGQGGVNDGAILIRSAWTVIYAGT